MDDWPSKGGEKLKLSTLSGYIFETLRQIDSSLKKMKYNVTHYKHPVELPMKASDVSQVSHEAQQKFVSEAQQIFDLIDEHLHIMNNVNITVAFQLVRILVGHWQLARNTIFWSSVRESNPSVFEEIETVMNYRHPLIRFEDTETIEKESKQNLCYHLSQDLAVCGVQSGKFFGKRAADQYQTQFYLQTKPTVPLNLIHTSTDHSHHEELLDGEDTHLIFKAKQGRLFTSRAHAIIMRKEVFGYRRPDIVSLGAFQKRSAPFFIYGGTCMRSRVWKVKHALPNIPTELQEILRDLPILCGDRLNFVFEAQIDNGTEAPDQRYLSAKKTSIFGTYNYGLKRAEEWEENCVFCAMPFQRMQTV